MLAKEVQSYGSRDATVGGSCRPKHAGHASLELPLRRHIIVRQHYIISAHHTVVVFSLFVDSIALRGSTNMDRTDYAGMLVSKDMRSTQLPRVWAYKKHDADESQSHSPSCSLRKRLIF